MAPTGVSIAFTANWDDVNPTWTQLDTGAANYSVQSWTIDRGRQSEIDKTSTGEAQIKIRDWSGAFDPTYSSGAYYGQMDPMRQVAIALQNPVTGTVSTLFRGFVSRWTYELHETKKFLDVTIDCVDGLEVLANAELITTTHGTVPPDISTGDVYYLKGSITDPGGLSECQDRIDAALDDAGWPASLRDVFSGNVSVRPTVYSAREQFLNVIDDAADAEFPGVANRYIDKDGNFVFHGRLARFNPADVQYDITTWKAGDDAAVASDSTRAPISPPIVFERDVNDIVNAVYSAPQEIIDADIAGQFVTDATSIAKYGYRSLSFENLLTETGYLSTPDATDLEETLSFAQYYVDNKKNPLTRLPQVTFKSRDPGDSEAAKVWALMCGVDISDIIDLSTTHAWGGGFTGSYFVEGCHYECVPGSSRTPHNVTLTLDISPRAYYGTAEW